MLSAVIILTIKLFKCSHSYVLFKVEYERPLFKTGRMLLNKTQLKSGNTGSLPHATHNLIKILIQPTFLSCSISRKQC
jgi:hypothetical protein